jgi:hypothetical protein
MPCSRVSAPCLVSVSAPLNQLLFHYLSVKREATGLYRNTHLVAEYRSVRFAFSPLQTSVTLPDPEVSPCHRHSKDSLARFLGLTTLLGSRSFSPPLLSSLLLSLGCGSRSAFPTHMESALYTARFATVRTRRLAVRLSRPPSYYLAWQRIFLVAVSMHVSLLVWHPIAWASFTSHNRKMDAAQRHHLNANPILPVVPQA